MKTPKLKNVSVFRTTGKVGWVVRVDVSTHVFIGRLEFARGEYGWRMGGPVGVGLVEVYAVDDGIEMFQGYAEGLQRAALDAPLLEAARREWNKLRNQRSAS